MASSESNKTPLMEQLRSTVSNAIAPASKEQQPLPRMMVCGVTGQQGGSVARALYRTGKWRVCGITRDASSDAAKKLREECPGVEFVEADMLDKDKLTQGMAGAKAVFCVTDFYTERNLKKAKEGVSGELQEGSSVAEAARAAGVEYFIMSSLTNAKQVSKGRWGVLHFTGKAQVADKAKELGLKVIEVMPGVFMQNFSSGLFPLIEPKLDGSIEWRLPVRHEVGLPLINIAQYGTYVETVMANPEAWVGKQVLVASEYLTLDQAASIYAQVSGTPTYYRRQTMEEYREENKKLPYVDEYVEQFSWFNEWGYFAGQSLRDTLINFPHTHTFREWLLADGWRTKPSKIGSALSSVGLGAKQTDPPGSRISAPGVKDAGEHLDSTAAKERLEFEQAGIEHSGRRV